MHMQLEHESHLDFEFVDFPLFKQIARTVQTSLRTFASIPEEGDVDASICTSSAHSPCVNVDVVDYTWKKYLSSGHGDDHHIATGEK